MMFGKKRRFFKMLDSLIDGLQNTKYGMEVNQDLAEKFFASLVAMDVVNADKTSINTNKIAWLAMLPLKAKEDGYPRYVQLSTTITFLLSSIIFKDFDFDNKASAEQVVYGSNKRIMTDPVDWENDVVAPMKNLSDSFLPLVEISKNS